uniref:vinorine synthase-like n=1 Tax=Erigeron canadensis TaxID=72917 RepID=UPI001CB98427|nr:vinorine synthase-like [Erigeron canadensis]
MSLRSYVHISIPFASSMKIHRVKVVMAMKVEIQSRKLIKPSVSTPSALRQYKLSIIDELSPEMNIPLVLFFPPNLHTSQEPIAQLKESLKEALTPFYPFAGSYMENISTIDCNDQGVEFIQARADITIKEILDHKLDPHTVNQLSPSKLLGSNVTNAMLATQVTMFQCGGLALSVSIAHRIGDASAMNSFLTQWATLSRKNIKVESCGTDFTSSLLFPAQGLPSIEVGFAKLPINDEYVTKRLSFNANGISNMKAKVMRNGDSNTRQLFKVQLVSALIWKTFSDVDYAIHGHPRDSILLQSLALRQKGEKLASMKAKISLGNHWGPIITRCDATKTVKEPEE